MGLPELATRFGSLQSIEKVPVFSLLALLPGPLLRLPFDAASVRGSPALSWISRDTSKPGSPPSCLSADENMGSSGILFVFSAVPRSKPV